MPEGPRPTIGVLCPAGLKFSPNNRKPLIGRGDATDNEGFVSCRPAAPALNPGSPWPSETLWAPDSGSRILAAEKKPQTRMYPYLYDTLAHRTPKEAPFGEEPLGLAAQIPCAKFQTSLRQIHERVSRHLPLGFHKVPLTSAFRATAGRRPSLSPRPVWKFDRTCAEGSIPAPAAGRDVKPQKSLSSPKPAEASGRPPGPLGA